MGVTGIQVHPGKSDPHIGFCRVDVTKTPCLNVAAATTEIGQST
jgi:hypothetical protein